MSYLPWVYYGIFTHLYKTIDKEPSKYHLYMGIFLMGESWETEFH